MIPALLALLQVILIDVSLSGDNAVVIGMAAAGLDPKQRKLAILFGMLGAIALRVAFSVGAIQLYNVPYLLFAGGLALLWVSWNMLQDLLDQGSGADEPYHHPATLWSAITKILIADLSMSIDNVLAVAGASREHPYIMAFGLLLSIGFMAVAANFIAKLLTKWPWLCYAGLALILWVAGRMIYEGAIPTYEMLKGFIHV